MSPIASLADRLKRRLSGASGSRRNRRRNGIISGDVLEQRIVPASVVWTGGSLLNDNWSTPKNWKDEIIPRSGDSVTFGPDVGRFDHAPINDITGLKLTAISIASGGYTLKGNAVELSNGLFTQFSEDGPVSGDLPKFSVIEQDVTSPANDDRIRIGMSGSGVLHMAGRISGPANTQLLIDRAFGAPQNETPKLFFTGAKSNSFGRTRVVSVQVSLARASGSVVIPGDLTLVNSASNPDLATTVFINQSEQISDSVNVQLIGNSRVQLASNISETVNSLSFTSPRLDGTRILGNGNLTVSSTITATISSQLNDPTVVTIPIHVKSLKRTGAGTLTFDVAKNRVISVQAAVGGNTGIRKTGEGTLLFGGTTANTYSGTTFVETGSMGFQKPSGISALMGNLEIGIASATQTAISASPAVKVSLQGNEIVSDTSRITVHPNGVVQAFGVSGPADEIFGELVLNGGRVTTFRKFSPKRVTIQASGLGSQVLGDLHVPTTTSGTPLANTVEYTVADGVAANDLDVKGITGSGRWLKRGPGTMVDKLNDTTLVQTVTVNEGKLVLLAVRDLTSVTVASPGVLTGLATIRTLDVIAGGRVDISNRLTVRGNVNLRPLAILQLLPQSTTTNRIHLITSGDVILGDANTQGFPVLDLQPQGTLPLGTQLTVVRVAADKTLTGKLATPTSAGGTVLNQGATFTAGGQNFSISYTGGASGKDVIVTRNSGPAFVDRALPRVAKEGEIVTLRGRITEPDAGDTFHLTVNWGDGQTEKLEFAAGVDPNLQIQHKYAQNGIYHVKLEWRDQHGGGNVGAHRIRIRNQRPILENITASSPIRRNSTASLFGRVRDAGANDELRVTVRWGDGSGVETLTVNQTGEFTASHSFRRFGRYRVTVKVFDGTAVTTTRTWITVLR